MNPLAEPLFQLLEFITSGRRYETRNPYCFDEVKQAMKALMVLCGKPDGDWLDAKEVYLEFKKSENK